jgi:predicted MPP superfamily phosphohydrolase
VKTPKFSWLHLSDVHVGHPSRSWDSAKVLASVSQAIEDAVSAVGIAPSFLFFTGDLAFGHAKGTQPVGMQLHEGASILKSIARQVSPPIEDQNIFLVPGNHDIDRSFVTDGVAAILDKADLTTVQKMILEAGTDWAFVTARQTAYRDTIKALFPHLTGDGQRAIYAATRSIGATKVGIVGLNSAWSCGKDGERGRLWMGARYQVETLLPQIAKTDFRILLSHHPSGWFAEAEEADFWRTVPQVEFDAHLHGHEHDSWVTALQNGHVRIAAGAVYEQSHKPTGFNVTVVDTATRSGWSHIRKYDNRGRVWTVENVPGHTSVNGDWPIERFGRTNRSSAEIAALIQSMRANQDEATLPVLAQSFGTVTLANEPSASNSPTIVQTQGALLREDEFRAVIKEIAGIDLPEMSMSDLVEKIGSIFSFQPQNAFLEAAQCILGLPRPDDTESVRIVLFGGQLEGVSNVFVSDTHRTATPRDYPAQSSLVELVHKLLPKAEVTNYVVSSGDHADMSVVAQGLEMAADSDAQIAILPFAGSAPNQILLQIAMWLLEERNVIIVAPDILESFRRSEPEATPTVCSVRQRIQGVEPRLDQPTIITPFPEVVSPLALTTALVANLIRDANKRQLANPAAKVLRSMYLDARISVGQFASYPRVAALMTASTAN